MTGPTRPWKHNWSKPGWAADPVPPWLGLRTGTLPVIIVAPHGGRRLRRVQWGDGVNDLHTAEIAAELAERLDAHALVNHGLDRNEVDLNRVASLVDEAPQVLTMLRRAVEDVAADSACPALVLFVHGWNSVLACCDVGVGLRRRGQRLTGRHPTMSRHGYQHAVTSLETALHTRGVSTAVGRRYAAGAANNATQLFSGRHRDHDNTDVARLAELALAGSVDAIQLELGIPLRWPGSLRQKLVEGLVESVGRIVDGAGSLGASAEPSATIAATGTAAVIVASGSGDPAQGAAQDVRAWSLPPQPRSEPHKVEAGYTVQTVLQGGHIGLFLAVEATGPVSMAARVSVVVDDGSMFLLVGEGHRRGQGGVYDMESFSWQAAEDGSIDVRVRGPMIRYPTHDAYLDLEQGLAVSELAEATIELRFEPDGNGTGSLRGQLQVGTLDLSVDARAFSERGSRATPSVSNRLRLFVLGSDGEVLRWRGELNTDLGGVAAGPNGPVPVVANPSDESENDRASGGPAVVPASVNVYASEPYDQLAATGVEGVAGGDGSAGVERTGATALQGAELQLPSFSHVTLQEDDDGTACLHLWDQADAESETAARRAPVLSRVRVWRPFPKGGAARWSFGVVTLGGSANIAAIFDRLELFGPDDLPQR